ncbi:MAG: hypothetical protein MUF51_01570, partial [Vicinamibacteria bacterium]|nr:hypothetical protein [Vicinamibacteria bacterium]
MAPGPADHQRTVSRKMRGGRCLRTAALALAAMLPAILLLTLNTPAVDPEADWDQLAPAGYKFWEDLAIATAHQVNDRRGDHSWAVQYDDALAASLGGLREVVLQATALQRIRPWQFWRTLPIEAFPPQQAIVIRSLDDRGRATLLGLGFHLLGGVAPYLLVWLGVILILPVMLWTAWEFAAAGRAIAGFVFLTLFGAAPFFAGVLALGYSSAGFYVHGLLMLVPLYVYALGGRGVSPRGFFARAAIAGLLFAAFTISRSSVILLLPAYALALFLGAWRVFGPRASAPARRPQPFLWPLLAAIALLWLPYIAVKPAQRHETWLSLWEGLGDFDRSKGHSWSDAAAKKALREAGGGERLRTVANEAVFRRLMLGHIQGDPLWFAGIVTRRALVTVSQRKLWPWATW